MAIITKEIFNSPYVDIGKGSDVCVLCRKEYIQEHKEDNDYQIDMALKDKLNGQRIFKLFQNSNTPFVLCKDHIHEIDSILQEDQ